MKFILAVDCFSALCVFVCLCVRIQSRKEHCSVYETILHEYVMQSIVLECGILIIHRQRSGIHSYLHR